MENKREVKYTNWVDFYNNNYKVLLEKFNESPEITSNFDLLEELYSSAIETLRIYLRNNGLFKQTNLDIIKECFYIDFIEDGEEWIDLFEQFEISKDKLIDSFFINKCATTFNRLNEKFIGVLENDC